jgi:hypothetical protein
MLQILLFAISQNSFASNNITESDTYVVSDAAHIFALDPFGVDAVTRHASIDNILEDFGLPIEIKIGKEVQLQFSRYVPVDYIYPGFRFTFGFESHWTQSSQNNEAEYEPFKVIETVREFEIISPDVKLRNGIHVGMKWNDVVEKLGKPYEDYSYYSSDSYTYRSNTLYYDLTKFKDAVTFKFEVDKKETVTKIVWPRYEPD